VPEHDAATGSTGAGSRTALRRRIRERRRALSGAQRQTAQQQAACRLRRLSPLWRARSVAIYLAVDGEADPGAIAAVALTRGQRVYAPVLHGETLRFARLTGDTPLRRNRFGILEPAAADCIDPRQLDVVLTPLVAFDDSGTRIGMGGGYYDRFFAASPETARIGIAHECQRAPALPATSSDVSLTAVVTENGWQDF